jgi:hypothetical protein
MALVVIGGHSRSVGKTSVVAGLIAALHEYSWHAMKITQFGHGVCSRNGELCDCATADHTWSISEERDRSGESDTSRFLIAGARKVWWVRSQQGRLAEAMPTIRRRIAEAENIIVESNSILKFMRPDIYLTVLDPTVEDFKQSAQEFMDRADVVILHEAHATPAWRGISLKAVEGRPMFRVRPPEYVTPKVVEFVKERLKDIAVTKTSA